MGTYVLQALEADAENEAPQGGSAMQARLDRLLEACPDTESEDHEHVTGIQTLSAKAQVSRDAEYEQASQENDGITGRTRKRRRVHKLRHAECETTGADDGCEEATLHVGGIGPLNSPDIESEEHEHAAIIQASSAKAQVPRDTEYEQALQDNDGDAGRRRKRRRAPKLRHTECEKTGADDGCEKAALHMGGIGPLNSPDTESEDHAHATGIHALRAKAQVPRDAQDEQALQDKDIITLRKKKRRNVPKLVQTKCQETGADDGCEVSRKGAEQSPSLETAALHVSSIGPLNGHERSKRSRLRHDRCPSPMSEHERRKRSSKRRRRSLSPQTGALYGRLGSAEAEKLLQATLQASAATVMAAFGNTLQMTNLGLGYGHLPLGYGSLPIPPAPPPPPPPPPQPCQEYGMPADPALGNLSRDIDLDEL
eukprot:TRINITY_DN10434_c0_g1_i1.p1 TRINITY_DN10434_c0_g1~~TRINITY_DN10434_c0_g1_i1.p1  ORF type:complete len:425 (+),score=58.13 TRINITY_DN10434_c0_g1_i1:93-1367(+)